MSTEPTLPSVDFSEAKARLSDVMTSVFHQRQPRLIERHRGKEAMLLMRPDDLARALASFRFDPQVVYADGGQEVTVVLEQFGVLGFGATFEAALADSVRELREYAQEFFAQFTFYSATDRAAHLPWLLRFALTPPDRQAELLIEDSRAAAGRAG
ncbi:MAG: hypothetical protein HY690_04595 [Chloroflexi bacterium]|nr:hypothetical protein [Chloroflexota bacterium]